MKRVQSILVLHAAAAKQSRNFSSAAQHISAVAARRSQLFTAEQERQTSLVRRVEKIKVEYSGIPEPCTLLMNKMLSTPYECSLHLKQNIRDLAVVAFVDGKPWDMHRPLEGDCELQFGHFKDLDIGRLRAVNLAFWRSCSFLLGYLIERSFKESVRVDLHSWPVLRIESGSFVHDAALSLNDWTANERELQRMSSNMIPLVLDKKRFERLNVNLAVAQDIFSENKFKLEQVTSMADNGMEKFTLYRCDDHVDMSVGPMIADASQIRMLEIVSDHLLETSSGLIHRFQGVAIPKQFTVSPFARRVLKQRAVKLNTVGLPEESDSAPQLTESEDDEPQARQASQ